jgi:hypothetical protein
MVVAARLMNIELRRIAQDCLEIAKRTHPKAVANVLYARDLRRPNDGKSTIQAPTWVIDYQRHWF